MVTERLCIWKRYTYGVALHFCTSRQSVQFLITQGALSVDRDLNAPCGEISILHNTKNTTFMSSCKTMERKKSMKNRWPWCDSNPGPSVWKSNGLLIELATQMNITWRAGYIWHIHSFTYSVLKRPRGRAVSAPDFGSRGRGFESRWRRDSSRT